MPPRFRANPFCSPYIAVAGSSGASGWRSTTTGESRLARTILFCLFAATASASNDRIVTAVFSRTYNGYERPRAADGSFEREYYALANGSYMPGVAADASIDKVKFPQIAGAHGAAPRAAQLSPRARLKTGPVPPRDHLGQDDPV